MPILILVLFLLFFGLGSDQSGMYCSKHGRRSCWRCWDEWRREIERNSLDNRFADLIQANQSKIDQEITERGFCDVSLDGHTLRLSRATEGREAGV